MLNEIELSMLRLIRREGIAQVSLLNYEVWFPLYERGYVSTIYAAGFMATDLTELGQESINV